MDIISGYLLAISHTMQAVYGDSVITDKELSFKINFLPDGFQEATNAELDKEIGNKKVIDDAKKIIDDYFSQLQ